MRELEAPTRVGGARWGEGEECKGNRDKSLA